MSRPQRAPRSRATPVPGLVVWRHFSGWAVGLPCGATAWEELFGRKCLVAFRTLRDAQRAATSIGACVDWTLPREEIRRRIDPEILGRRLRREQWIARNRRREHPTSGLGRGRGGAAE